MRKIIIISIIIITIFSVFLFIKGNAQIPVIRTKPLTVYFLNVGQGDAILIQTPNKKNILIDGGPDNSVLSELGKVMDFYDKKIDIMILTHPHSDHVVGLTEILKRYQVKQIYYTGVLHTSPDYLEWLKKINSLKIPFTIVKEPFNLEVENEIQLDFLFPNYDFTNQRVTELNNTSIVNRLVYNKISFLFMGDAEIEVEEKLLTCLRRQANNLQLKSDVLKVGHHGSHSSTAEDFLEAVQPDYAIISVGLDNEFNHPHLITIRRLENLPTKILRTDENGTIICQTDGNTVDCHVDK